MDTWFNRFFIILRARKVHRNIQVLNSVSYAVSHFVTLHSVQNALFSIKPLTSEIALQEMRIRGGLHIFVRGVPVVPSIFDSLASQSLRQWLGAKNSGLSGLQTGISG